MAETTLPDDLKALEKASLLARRSWEAQALVSAHPPRLKDKNKRHLHALCCPPGTTHRGTISVARYRAMALPEVVPAEGVRPLEHIMRETAFSYEPPAAGAMEWHLNFADAHLFGYYGGALFAQDEMQVAEHPALGSVREALLELKDPNLEPFTRAGDRPTPVLVRGVERRCSVDTDPDLTAGRIYGLYGNAFARAKPEQITQATTVLTPPTISNILAMEAPPGGRGRYTREQVEDVVTTAYTGFSAARIESHLESGASPLLVIHTGHWGTGAFGGNKVMMTILQMTAARLAGIDRLVYHSFSQEGTDAYEEGRRIFKKDLLPGATKVGALLDAIVELGLAWGVSDGN